MDSHTTKILHERKCDIRAIVPRTGSTQCPVCIDIDALVATDAHSYAGRDIAVASAALDQ